MNRYDKGNEAWTEAFRNSYLSEPVPGESGDGWATVSSLAARRQTRRRLLGVAAALLPLFIAGGLGLGLGLGSDTQTADGALVADGSDGNIYASDVSDRNIYAPDGSDATIEENIYLADGSDDGNIYDNIYVADSSDDRNIIDENIYLADENIYLADGNINLADGGDDAKTYADEEIYTIENEKLMPDNERVVPEREAQGAGREIEIVPRKERKLLAALELSLNGMPGGSGPKLVAGGTGPGMMALTTPFSPDTKQFEARQEDIYENASFRHHMPLGAGVGISFALGEKLALESGLNYTLLWSELTPEGGNVRQNQYIHYLGIPLQLDWIFFDRAGFRLYSGIGARMDICAGARIDGVKVKEDPLQWSASATVGAGYNFNRHVGIYLRPELDFYLSGTRLNSVRKAGGVNVTLRAGLQISL
ncbi:MAG: PorT family protein [Bacteroidales bacterium]|nr:PorT family protein [Bacteroidales bacterium]